MYNVLEYDQARKTVLDEDTIRLYIPKKIKEVKRDGKTVDFMCEGWEYRKDIMNIWFNQLNRNLTPTGNVCDMTVRLEFKSSDIIRVRLVKGNGAKKRNTPMVLNDLIEEDFKIEFSEMEDFFVIKTESLNIKVYKEFWNLQITDKKGKVLLDQYNYDKHSINELIKYQGEAQDDYSSFNCYPFGIAHNRETNEKAAFDSIRMSHDESFFGFGEKYSKINKRGQEVLCWHFDALGTSTQKSYKNIPFFMSSRGYGIYLNTIYKSKYRMGDYFFKAYQIETAEEELDYYFIYGPQFKQILKKYTDLTGKTPLPPKWSFGIWMSRNSYRSEEEILEIARQLREKELPCDVLHLDVDWFKEPFICDYEFDEERYPDPAKMLDRVSEMGYHMSLWQLPYISKKSKIYVEGLEKGYFERFSNSDNTEVMIDFSNPEAVEWYKSKIRPLLEKGFSVIKADFADGVEVDAVYQEYTGKAFHNLYPLIYHKILYELTKEVHGEENALIWARSAYAGSQRYPVHWAGDSDSDFSSLASTLRGGLSLGMSGFPFWSHDIGGYYTTPEPDCYIRWMQVGMFSSHARFHGVSAREPWAFGEKAVEVYRDFARIRYELIPYIYSEAKKCIDNSIPMVRPLVLEYQDDPTVEHIDDQYLFGDSILVAPILSKENKRRVYLPAGKWVDFWNRDICYQGNSWIEYEAGLDRMPLFIKKGSIIPCGPAMQYVGEKEFDPLYLHIFHQKEEKYDFYDENEQFKISCCEENGNIQIDINPTQRNLKFLVYGTKDVKRVLCNGKEVKFSIQNDILEFDFGPES